MTLEQNQIDIVAKSKSALDRACAYETRLSDHLADLDMRIEAGARDRAAAAMAGDPMPDVDVAALRSEAKTVTEQYHFAKTATASLRAEHDRQADDLKAMFGSSDAALEKLKGAREARVVAHAAADDKQALLCRAEAHLATLNGKLAAAQRHEAERQSAAVTRLHSELRVGNDVSFTKRGVIRASLALENDVQTAAAMVERLRDDHRAAVSTVQAAEDAVDLAVEAVLAVEAETAAAELLALRVRSTALRDQLRAYAAHTPRRRRQVQVPNPARPIVPGSPLLVRDPSPVAMPHIGRSAIVMKALQPDERPLFDPAPTSEADHWRAREAALIADTVTPASSPEPRPQSVAA